MVQQARQRTQEAVAQRGSRAGYKADGTHHYLHTASRRIIDFLVEEGIGTVVIGLNPLWKQECNLGKRTNQNFVSIVRLVQPKPVKGRKAGKAQ
jgi:hypothetical protein